MATDANNAGTIDYDVKVTLDSLRSEFSKADQEASKRAKELGGNVDSNIKSGTDQAAARFDELKGRALLALKGIGIAAGVAGIASIKMAGDFEKSMNVLGSVSGATSDQLSQLAAKARELGKDASLPGISAANAAEAMTELAKAGLSVNDVLAASKGVLSLAKAGDLEVADAALIAAQALNAFKLKGQDASRVADILAAGANASAASVEGMALGMQMSAAIADQFGIKLEDTVTALAIFANRGIQGSDAGTSLKTMLISLARPTGEASELMKKLGINAFDAKGQFVGLRQLAINLQKGLKGLTLEQQNNALATIFGTDAFRAAAFLADSAGKAYDDMSKAVNRTGAATELAAAQNKGFNGALDNLRSTLETIGTDIALKALPGITSFINGVAGKLPAIADAGMKFAEKFANAFEAGLTKMNNLADVVIDKLQAGDYVGAGEKIATGVIHGIKSLTRRAMEIWGIVKDALGKVDWIGIGLDIGGKVIPGLAIGLIAGVLNMDFGEIFSGVKQHLGEIFLAALTIAFAPAKLVGKIGAIFAKIPLAGKFIESFIDGLNRGGQALLRGAGNLVKSFVGGFIDQLGLQGAKIVPAITKFFKLLPTRVGVAVLDMYQAAERLMSSFGRAIAETGPRNVVIGLRMLRDNIFSFFGTMARSFIDMGSGVIRNIQIGMKMMADGPVRSIREVCGKIFGALSDAGSFLFNKGVDLIGGLSRGISTAFTYVVNFFANIGSRAFGAVGDLWSVLYNKGMDLLGGFVAGVDNKLASAAGFFKSIGSQVLGFIGDVSWVLYEHGRSLIMGLINGAGSLLSKIGEFFLDKLPNWIKGPFKKALGIKSPSKIFEGFGINIGKGLVGGIDAMRSNVRSAMDGMSSLVSGSFTPSLSFAPSMSGATLESSTLASAAIAQQNGNANLMPSQGGFGQVQIVNNNNITSGVTVDQVARAQARELRRLP